MRHQYALILIALVALACADDTLVAPSGTVSFAPGGNVRPLVWTPRASMPVAVGAAVATADADRIYMFGGGALNVHSTLNQIYDPATDTWTLGAPFPVASDFAMAGAMRDGIHLVGGVNRETRHDVYDRATDSWTPAAALPVGVRAAVSEVLKHELYVIGGVGSSAGVTNVVQIYNQRRDLWTSGTPMPTPRLSAVSTVIGGKIYVAGGEEPGFVTSDAFEMYDPRRDTWTVLPSLPVVRESMGGGAIQNRFCVFGGRLTNPSPTGSAFSETYCYDVKAGAWTQGPNMVTPRVTMGSVEYGGGVYALAGRLGSGVLTTVEVLGKQTGKP